MKIELSHTALKFLEKLDESNRNRIRDKINILTNSIEEYGIIPYKTLDIKTLKGNWYPLKRLRTGKIRVLFYIEYESETIKISEIDNRGDIY
ncbi:MAG TPA: type II toxin-antitoxin system RelE/ParE family toxin [Candidatus Kapabacteria bacterium]|nr:type II toxin-antitoxin system RelE/ParE family toxin [Candidatus Kapabacteria bacterium]